MQIRNKKGGEKLLSLWWFFVLIIVTLGVVGAVVLFYSADVDVRTVEAGILANKLQSCLTNNGYLVSENVLKEGLYENCSLSREVFTEGNDFFFKIRVTDSNNQEKYLVYGGNKAFEKDCFIDPKITAKKYPSCVKKQFSLLAYDTDKQEKLNVEIITGSNQMGRKIVTA